MISRRRPPVFDAKGLAVAFLFNSDQENKC